MNSTHRLARHVPAQGAGSSSPGSRPVTVKGAAILLVITGLFAALAIEADGDGQPHPPPMSRLRGTAGTPPSGAGDWRRVAGSQVGQEVEGHPVATPGSAVQDPFQTGRSWSTGSATSSGQVVYLDPDSEAFQAAARKVRAEHDEVVGEASIQLVQPMPPDPAAAF